jgi:hypothetical protein
MFNFLHVIEYVSRIVFCGSNCELFVLSRIPLRQCRETFTSRGPNQEKKRKEKVCGPRYKSYLCFLICFISPNILSFVLPILGRQNLFEFNFKNLN